MVPTFTWGLVRAKVPTAMGLNSKVRHTPDGLSGRPSRRLGAGIPSRLHQVSNSLTCAEGSTRVEPPTPDTRSYTSRRTRLPKPLAPTPFDTLSMRTTKGPSTNVLKGTEKPPKGLEPLTSPLPRECSTTELRWPETSMQNRTLVQKDDRSEASKARVHRRREGGES